MRSCLPVRGWIVSELFIPKSGSNAFHLLCVFPRRVRASSLWKGRRGVLSMMKKRAIVPVSNAPASGFLAEAVQAV